MKTSTQAIYAHRIDIEFMRTIDKIYGLNLSRKDWPYKMETISASGYNCSYILEYVPKRDERVVFEGFLLLDKDREFGMRMQCGKYFPISSEVYQLGKPFPETWSDIVFISVNMLD